MKVAFVIEWLDAWRGGAETSSLQFVHRLMERDVDLHVFTRSRPSPAPNLHIHTISGASLSRARRSITFAHRVERKLAENEFDVVHAISPCRGADIYQPRGGTVAETIARNVALLRSSSARRLKRLGNRFNVKQRYMLNLERQMLDHSDAPVVAAVSGYVVRQLQQHYGLPEDRIRLIYNGVTPTPLAADDAAQARAGIRQEYKVRDDQLFVLLIAHNFRLKGVARWMEALAQLAKHSNGGVKSVIIGKGDTMRWHRLAARMGLSDCLTFAGPSDRISAFHQAGDALVHPTYYDPCSRVVLEAMSVGLPCLTTRWDGASEVIEDGLNGFVIDDPSDTQALADRVQQWLVPEFRLRQGVEARKVTDRVSMARHATEMMQLYDEVAQSKQAGSG